MSAFASLASALPLKADVAALGRESPKMTRCGPGIDEGEVEDLDEVRGLIDPSLFLGLPAPSSEDSQVGELE